MTSTDVPLDELTSTAAAARAGDIDAASRLSALATGAARRIAAPLVNDASAVDDIAQEAVLEMLATLHRLREPQAYVAWFRLIVRKQADRHRRRHRRTDVVIEGDSWTNAADDPAALVARDDENEVVRRALAATSDADRAILAARYFDELSDRELAGLLDITPAAVRKRLFDARRRLRPVLAAQLDRATTPRPKEPLMSLDTLFGRVLTPDEARAHANATRAVPTAPATFGPLVSGFPMIDLFAPLPRGGIAEFRPGNIRYLAELICNISTAGPVALVGVGASRPSPDGIYSRFHNLTMPERTAALSIAVMSTDGRDDVAVEAGGELAAAIAADGTDVLLAIDEVISASIDESTLRRVAGMIGSGSVTGLRTGRLLSPKVPPLWVDADALIRFKTTHLDDISMTFDLDASWSKAIESADLSEEYVTAARAAKQLLQRADRTKAALSQSFDQSDGWAGHSTNYVSPEAAIAVLDDVLSS